MAGCTSCIRAIVNFFDGSNYPAPIRMPEIPQVALDTEHMGRFLFFSRYVFISWVYEKMLVNLFQRMKFFIFLHKILNSLNKIWNSFSSFLF